MNVGGLTLVDWIIVILLAGSVLAGLARGFFRSVFSLAGLIAGVALASWNYWRVASFLKRFIHSVEIADAVAFLIIAFLVMAVAAILGSLFAKFFEKVGLGCLDRFAVRSLVSLRDWFSLPSAFWLRSRSSPRQPG